MERETTTRATRPLALRAAVLALVLCGVLLAPVAQAAGAEPTVTGLSPPSGAAKGGNTVTITGTSFTGATAVKFGATEAIFVVKSETSIEATAPAGTGKVLVAVSTPGGTNITGAEYTYVPAPVVTSLSPESGPAAGGTTVTIKGEHLAAATGVKFGATAATSFKVESSTTITATAPAGAAGTPIDVTVETAGGTSATNGADTFTYRPLPTVTSLSTEGFPETGGNPVTIKGAHLGGATEVKFGSVVLTPPQFEQKGETEIILKAPPGKETVQVTVTTADGTSAPVEYAYVPAPVVKKLSQESGPAAGETSITITGEHLANVTEVKFGTNRGKINMATVTEEAIEVTAPAGSGKVSVTVTTPGGTNTTGPEYTYIAPSSGGGSSSGGSTSSGSTTTATTATTPKTAPPPPPIRVTVPLVSLLHSRVIHGSTLEVRFTLAVKARVRLVARRGHRIVASTSTRTLKAGVCRLLLRLDRKHWPTKLELLTHPLVALPTILRAA